MDAPQTPIPETPKVEEKPISSVSSTVQASKKKFPVKKMLLVLVGLLLLAGAAYGGYWWRDRDAKKHEKAEHAEIEALEEKVADLEAADKADPSSIDETEDSAQPTAEQLENIKASISSGDTAALEGRMAESVTVVLAASEGLDARTAAEAIADIDYVIDLEATWDFVLADGVLEGYASGDYGQYFPAGALVGLSSEGKVISFVFDGDAKIKTIFMSVSDDLL